jgi:GNAT superfamily N-acetyltransferase
MEPMIRLYETSDRDAVVALALRAWEPVFESMHQILGDEIDTLLHGANWRAYQQREVEAALDDARMHRWVAVSDGVVLAFMAVRLDPQRSVGQLWMIAVDPNSQNHGLGTTMTNLATDWMRAAGMRVAMIGTGGDPGHAPARRVYEKAGYTAIPVANYFMAL